MLERERSLAARERAVQQTCRQRDLIKKLDQWLATPINHRDIFIDPQLVCFVMSEHPFVYMQEHERRRINMARIDIDRMREIYYSEQLNELCCPICFDSLQSPRKRIIALECGHVYCLNCIEMMQLSIRELAIEHGEDANVNARCCECNREINSQKILRLFFAQRG